MTITGNSRVSDVAAAAPATIRIFQAHGIDFCCGGKRPLADACADRGVDVDALVTELRAVETKTSEERNWQAAPLSELVGHIQARFHQPLRAELPRLEAMMDKVLTKHGDQFPQVLHPLHVMLSELQEDLLQHIAREDAVLFPAIVGLDLGGSGGSSWIGQPIKMMEAEHDMAGRTLAHMRELTHDYTPPEWACPTFRGLYYGLAELERDMHVHVHLENNVLFPRAASLAVAG
jgi:regulator of cell morphogenesis and NO signaling